MATYLNQDKNAILKEVGGGIEYYDVVINTTHDDLSLITNNFTNEAGMLDLQQLGLLNLLEKANKALNVHFISDGHKFSISEVIRDNNDHYPLTLKFYDVDLDEGNINSYTGYIFNHTGNGIFNIKYIEF